MKAIPWYWLKQTPQGARGIIPGVGIRYVHRPARPGHVHQILVDVGTGQGWMGRGVLRLLPEKGGWGKPHLVAYDGEDFS